VVNNPTNRFDFGSPFGIHHVYKKLTNPSNMLKTTIINKPIRSFRILT
jgi:hypothetical protein